MSLPELLAEHGYLAVLVGSLLEGETILALAGYAAHQGYLSLPVVMLVAFFGGTLGDQIFFFIGRHYGKELLDRVPRFAAGAQRVDRLLLRYHAGLIIGVRFMYGLRIVGPIAIGMSGVPASRFLLFNMIGAAIWAPLIAGAGFLFGESMHWLIDDLGAYEGVGAALIVLLVIAIAVAHRVLSRRARERRLTR